MSEGPYRTPAEIDKDKITLLDRIGKNKAATGFTGIAFIGLVILTVVTVIEIPGLLILRGLAMLNGKGMPTGNDKYMLAAACTFAALVIGYFAQKFVRGLAEMAFEVGKNVLEYIQLYLERRK